MGREFQSVTAAFPNCLSPYVEVLVRVILKEVVRSDLNDLHCLYLSIKSQMYTGDPPCRALKVCTITLYSRQYLLATSVTRLGQRLYVRVIVSWLWSLLHCFVPVVVCLWEQPEVHGGVRYNSLSAMLQDHEPMILVLQILSLCIESTNNVLFSNHSQLVLYDLTYCSD